MLSKIYIRNYILIDELELEFLDGLNIITGETGAGKSIIINAVDIVLGARCGKEVIKSGCDKAVIEVTVRNKKHNTSEIFENYGIDNYADEIIISREISLNGSRYRVNGTLVNQECIKVMREMFMDIHSQHQTYSLLQPKYHIVLLDSYMKNAYGDVISGYQELYNEYKNYKQELENLLNQSQKTEEQIDFLKYQISEIEDAQIISTHEDDELNNELLVLNNIEKLKELTGCAYWTLSGDDDSVLDALAQIKASISKAVPYDNNLEEYEQKVIDSFENLKELSTQLRDYSSSLMNDTERINIIQERLFLLDKLKRKHGGSLENVLSTLLKMKKEYSEIEFSSEKIENLKNKIQIIEKDLYEKAQKISNERKKYAEVLTSLIIEKLEKMELPKVRFKIDFQEQSMDVSGIDKVEFLISTNISEELKPIAKVASGGEISRVMLAIKTIFAEADNIETVVFDEIDTGISGKTSQSVAEEVKNLSKYMQIIMITHQPIIASKSDEYIYVKKNQNETTNIVIKVLTEDEKISAIAELAGGIVSGESLQFAKKLVETV